MDQKNITKRLSKSKLLTFKTCPKQFWFSQYFPKWGQSSPAMKRGTELHDIFENFYKKFKGHENRSLSFVLNNLDLVPNAKKHPEQMKMFSEWTKRRGFPKPESMEEKIYSKSQDIVIQWDRVDYDGKRRVIWDYKTGNLYEGNEFRDKFTFELMVYAFIYMLETKKRVDYVGIYFIDHGKQNLIKVTDESIKEIIRQIMELKLQLNDYQKTNNWPETYSWKCRSCMWKDQCESYRRLNKK